MRVFVTGATGFLGSHIAEQLTKSGHTAVCLVRKTSDRKFLESLTGLELVEGSLDGAGNLTAALRGCDAVIHSAGLVKARTADEFHAVNAQGTERLADAARSAKVERFVLVSSLAAAGPSNDAGDPVPHDAPERPVTNYGRSKLAAERAARAIKDDLKLIILRPPALYGPRDREVLAFFKAIKARVLPVMGRRENKLSMLYGADCASACIAALGADVESGSTYFVDDGIAYTFEDLVSAAESALGIRAWVRVPIPRRVLVAAATLSELYGKLTDQAVMLTPDKCNELLAQWVCDSSNTRRELGWQPSVSFDEGARLTVAWYKQQGLL